MRITMYRSSGQPVEPDHKEAVLKELNDATDLAEEYLGKMCFDNAKDFQEILIPLHIELAEKYPNSKEIDLPTNEQDYKDLCSEYGSICFCLEDDKMVAYILE